MPILAVCEEVPQQVRRGIRSREGEVDGLLANVCHRAELKGLRMLQPHKKITGSVEKTTSLDCLDLL